MTSFSLFGGKPIKGKSEKSNKSIADMVEENAQATRELAHVLGRTPNKRGSNAIDELAQQLLKRRVPRWTEQ